MTVNADEAIETLKTRNPRLLVMLAELCAAVDAAKAANNPKPAWSRMGDAIVQIIRASGADDELLKQEIEEGHDATASAAQRVTRGDLDDADLRFADGGVAFLQMAFSRLLLSLPVGISGTTAGLAAVGSLMAAEEGFHPWLFDRAQRPGGGKSTDAGIEWLTIKSVLAEAARLNVHSGLSRRVAIIKAVATHGAKAMDKGIRLDPELLRVRSSRAATAHKPADRLHVYFTKRLEYERDRKFGRPRQPPKVV
jgi:hypothetical protein